MCTSSANLTAATPPPSSRSPPSSCSPQAETADDGFTSANCTTLDLGISGFPDSDFFEDVIDHFGSTTKSLTGNVVTTSNSVDSIIGLALETVLDSNGTTTPIAGNNEDSNSSLLASLSALKHSNLDFTEQSISTVDSSAALTAEVHIEELNSGVAGSSVPVSIASPTLENVLNPAIAVNGQSPVSTATNVFFSNTSPISSIVDSQSQQEALDKEPVPWRSLLLPPSTDCGDTSSFAPQWLNGEVQCSTLILL